MALYLKKELEDSRSLIGVWQITETEEELRELASVPSDEMEEISFIGSESMRKQRLAVRALLCELFGEKVYLSHHDNGKPYLENSVTNISITHTAKYVAVILNDNEDVGIDIESLARDFSVVERKALSEEEILSLDTVISPLIQQNQSPHHIYVTNKDEITVSERTIYRLIDSNLFTARNLDLRRKVRFSARKKTVQVKVDKKCRIGRSYEDFLEFMKQYPGLAIVELDSVEGKKGGKVLLTIHFTKAELMLAFIRERNDSKSVIEVFNRLYRELSSERFRKIFQVCLTDNGSEFSNPSAIEYDDEGNLRTRVFYCDPSAPYQKGSAETNHEFIREFIPKGKDMAPYTQDDISLMMDHINSYSRASLGDKCPYDMFSFLYGKEVLAILGCHKIPPQKVTLNSSIFKRSRPNEV